MEIVYRTRKLQKICCEKKQAIRDLGSRMADRLMQRINELEAAENLEDMKYLPGPRCHELTGDRQGELAVDLIHPKRLVFTPDQDPVPRKDDGGLDWTSVDRICILEIADYH